MAGESLFFWLGASADAETGHSAKPEPVSRLGPSGECPARCCECDNKTFDPLHLRGEIFCSLGCASLRSFRRGEYEC
jgi:hypothetical protein